MHEREVGEAAHDPVAACADPFYAAFIEVELMFGGHSFSLADLFHPFKMQKNKYI